jgi:ABC-type branched-subunit amino acid transport system permease subunit
LLRRRLIQAVIPQIPVHLLPSVSINAIAAVIEKRKIHMQKLNFQTLVIFSLGLITGILIRFSFTTLLAMLLAAISVFIYTLQDAKELKQNQDRYFAIISSLLYLAALLLSVYLTAALILFVSYEFCQRRNSKTIILRLLPFILITLFSLIIHNHRY